MIERERKREREREREREIKRLVFPLSSFQKEKKTVGRIQQQKEKDREINFSSSFSFFSKKNLLEGYNDRKRKIERLTFLFPSLSFQKKIYWKDTTISFSSSFSFFSKRKIYWKDTTRKRKINFSSFSFKREKKLLEGYNGRKRERDEEINFSSCFSFKKKKNCWKDTTVERERDEEINFSSSFSFKKKKKLLEGYNATERERERD